MNIEDARKEIDKIDTELIKLFEKRMSASAEIAKEKTEKNLPVYDEKREQEIIEKICNNCDEKYKNYFAEIYEKIFEVSRSFQKELMK